MYNYYKGFYYCKLLNFDKLFPLTAKNIFYLYVLLNMNKYYEYMKKAKSD